MTFVAKVSKKLKKDFVKSIKLYRLKNVCIYIQQVLNYNDFLQIENIIT